MKEQFPKKVFHISTDTFNRTNRSGVWQHIDLRVHYKTSVSQPLLVKVKTYSFNYVVQNVIWANQQYFITLVHMLCYICAKNCFIVKMQNIFLILTISLTIDRATAFKFILLISIRCYVLRSYNENKAKNLIL